MTFDICIPTLNRREKLNRCLGSLFKYCNGDVNVKLYFSDPFEYDDYKKLLFAIPNVSLFCLDYYRVPNFWNKCLQDSNSDVLVYLNDDVEIHENFLDKLKEAWYTHFPDFDGIIGINQSNLPEDQCLPSAFGAIGLKYASRFPNREVWAKDYHRFYCDKELMLYAESISKFYFARDVRINHYHAAFCGNEDETHRKVRTFLQQDKQTFKLRQTRNLLWGQTFERVTS